mmetsp:Transcript_10794/g.17684  ORF Transcript_10794/g.17684 Transcript_10794/m.17684 type:complete len:297 (-) Transcript_10794:1315-2205(-)
MSEKGDDALEGALSHVREAFHRELGLIQSFYEDKMIKVVNEKDGVVQELMRENRRIKQENESLTKEISRLRCEHTSENAKEVSRLRREHTSENIDSSNLLRSISKRSVDTQTVSRSPKNFKSPAPTASYLDFTRPVTPPNEHASLLAEIDRSLSAPQVGRGARTPTGGDNFSFRDISPIHQRPVAGYESEGDSLFSISQPDSHTIRISPKRRSPKRRSKASAKTQSPLTQGGKDFFKEARVFLSEAQFDELLHCMKKLNQSKVTRQETLTVARKLFGKSGENLYESFEKLLNGKVP